MRYNEDTRIVLVNKVSKDILENNKDNYILSVIQKVDEYNNVFDEVLRNYYEIKQNSETPLFELVDYIILGKENYALNEEEYIEKMSDLLIKVNKMFNINYKIKG